MRVLEALGDVGGVLGALGFLALGFVVLTLPIGIGVTRLSRRLAVKR